MNNKSKIYMFITFYKFYATASLSQCKLEKVNFKQTKLIKNNFFKTLLKGIDFSNNEFVAPTVSEPPVELRGLTVDRFQAAELAKLMGICIVE